MINAALSTIKSINVAVKFAFQWLLIKCIQLDPIKFPKIVFSVCADLVTWHTIRGLNLKVTCMAEEIP